MMTSTGAIAADASNTFIAYLRWTFQTDPDDYTDSVWTPTINETTSRDETTRNDVWDSTSSALLAQLEQDQADGVEVDLTDEPDTAAENYPQYDPGYDEARKESKRQQSAKKGSTEPEGKAFLEIEPSRSQSSGTIGGGPPLPWESGFHGGGSQGVNAIVNSNTGNRFTEVPLFSIPVRGGFTMKMSLYHNSLTGFNGQFGNKWSCDYDARLSINHEPGNWSNSNQAVLRWGDGTTLPYQYDVSQSRYLPPSGIYDSMTLSTTSGNNYPVWTLTTKEGVKYIFKSPKPGDSTYRQQGVLARIEWPGSTSNYIDIERPWNGSPRINAVKGPNGRNITFGHPVSGPGSVIQIKDSYAYNGAANRIWQFEYSSGRLTRIFMPSFPTANGALYSRDFTYTSANNIETEIDLNGNSYACAYDSNNRCTGYNELWVHHNETGLPAYWTYFDYYTGYSRSREGYSPARTFEHHYVAGRLRATKDQAGFWDEYGHVGSTSRQLTYYRDRKGKLWQYSLDSNGNVLSTTSPNGEHSYATYNSDSTVSSTYGDLSPSTVKYEYTNRTLNRAYRDLSTDLDLVTNSINTGSGLIDSTTTYDGTQSRTFTFTRNPYGEIQWTLDPRSETVETPYTEMGWVKRYINQNGKTTEIEYDRWGRPSRVAHPGGKHVDLEYDLEGNVTQVTDERGKVHTWEYNPQGLVRKYTNAKGEVEYYYYKESGFLFKVKNGRGYDRIYTPTVRDEVKELAMPDGTKEQWQYDANGNVSAYWGAYGSSDQVTNYYSYDDSGRPTFVDYPSGTDTTFAYTNYGHTVSMTDASGTTVWKYDSWGDLVELDTPQGNMDYEYNRLGERTKLTDTNGNTTYEYDNFGRLKKLTNWLSEITEWEFDDVGRLSKRKLHNGTWEDLAYDDRDRPTGITLKKPGPTTLRSHVYTYDDASNVASHSVDGVTTNYVYDDINQLLKEYKGTLSSPTWQIEYSYDANGNRATRNILGGVSETYTNDSGDKLTGVSWSGGSKSFTYDGAGRRKTMSQGGVTTFYTWDFESRIKEISRTGSTTNYYSYNGLDARVSKTDSTGTGARTFRRDGAYVTDPVLSDTVNSTTTNYTPGVSERRGSTSRYLHSGIKNADARTTTGSSVEASRAYDAFGNLVSSSGTWQGLFGYAGGFGYQEDDDYGLKLLGHRYYDSSTGRLLSRDPKGNGRNWSTYAANDPITNSDPNGLRELSASDIGRLHKLQRKMRSRKYSEAYINQVTKSLKQEISEVKGSNDPTRLRALWWAIEHLDDGSYGKDWYGRYHCNSFVGDAYARGAGLGYADEGGAYPVHRGRFVNSPLGANSLADPGYEVRYFPVARSARPGDIISFDAAGGGGHVTMKVAEGLLIYANDKGGTVGTYGFVNSRDNDPHRRKTIRRFGNR